MQPSAEESAATTTESDTPRSRACSAATCTSASVRRAPARASSRGSRSGGGGVFTGDIPSVTRFRVQASGVTLFFLPERQLLGSHHQTTVGVVSLGWGGMNPISMQGKHIRTELLLQAKSAKPEGGGRNRRPRADPRGCPWKPQEVKVSLSEAPVEPDTI